MRPAVPGLEALPAPAGGGTCGWYVRHLATGLPVLPPVRLRRHVDQALADLGATGADWAAANPGSLRTPEVLEVVVIWRRRAAGCCEGGEHYSPHSWRDGKRCSYEIRGK